MTTIKSLPLVERPRERCLTHGSQHLSLRELLAVILGTGPRGKGCLGVVDEILESWKLSQQDIEFEERFFQALFLESKIYLKNVNGLGDAGEARLLAAFELSKRYASYRMRQQQNHTETSFDRLQKKVLKKIPAQWKCERNEWIGIVGVQRDLKLSEFYPISTGNRFDVSFKAKDLFEALYRLQVPAYFLFHNHPSGDPKASNEDFILTRHLQELSKELDFKLLGHGIVAFENSSWV